MVDWMHRGHAGGHESWEGALFDIVVRLSDLMCAFLRELVGYRDHDLKM
jgi:hypothetical protein